MDLSDHEIRVLGCLLEKQRTTPDHYPLSLNSLRLACNQSTNREPVVDYDEAIVRDALHRLERRGYSRLASGRGSRAAKYRHLLSEALPMSDGEQAIMCVLMLRGPQTPGELKQRGERIHRFEALEEVHETLERLIDRRLLARLERRPGQKEERYAQLLGEDWDGSSPGVPGWSAGVPGSSPGVAGSRADAPVSSPGVPGSRADAPAGAEASPAPRSEHIPTNGHASAAGAPLAEVAPSATDDADLRDRVARLEREVAELRARLTQA
jgi:uncharacterized protein